MAEHGFERVMEISKDFQKYLNIADKLRSLVKTDKGNLINVPTMVVIGDQSSGKSSLLEMLSDIELPKGQRITTRLPLQIQLRKSCVSETKLSVTAKEEMKQSESLQSLLGPVTSAEVTKKVQSITDEIAGTDSDVKDIPIELTITGEGLVDLTLVDLPGLRRADSGKTGKNIGDEIRTMVKRYIEPKETIIVIVVPSNLDLAAVESVALAREVDQDFQRTFLVLTRCDQFTDTGLVQNFQNAQTEWNFYQDHIFLTRARSNEEALDSTPLSKVRSLERDLFEKREDWNDIPIQCKGTEKLGQRLAAMQEKMILDSFPGWKQQLEENLEECEMKHHEYGNAVSSISECLIELQRILLLLFTKLRSETTAFGDVSLDSKSLLICATFASMGDEYAEQIREIGSKRAFMSDAFGKEIRERSDKRRGGDTLPDEIHPTIAPNILRSIIEDTRKPSQVFVENVYCALKKTIKPFIEEGGGRFPKLQYAIEDALGRKLKRLKVDTLAHVNHKIDWERHCETKDRYYMDVVQQTKDVLFPKDKMKHPSVVRVTEAKDEQYNGEYIISDDSDSNKIWYKQLKGYNRVLKTYKEWSVTDPSKETIITNPNIRKVTFADISQISDYSIFEDLEIDGESVLKMDNREQMVVAEAIKINAYWKLVHKQIIDQICKCVRWHMLHAISTNDTQTEIQSDILSEEIENIQRLMAEDENIIFKRKAIQTKIKQIQSCLEEIAKIAK